MIEASGYFDATWYLSTYPDAAEAEGAPFQHYLRQGYREGKNPSPLFDSARYLADHPDVAAADVNPLVQFLRAPAAEGRSAWTMGVPPAAGHEDLVVRLQPKADRPPRVAVVVHAYYAETFEEISASLRSIPFPFTLFVSVPDAQARQAVMRSVKRHHLPARLDVRICPNRGRNFAPLTAEFARDILDYEFVLHLHTKKSLYTGSDQTAWRDELVHSLVGSPALVTASLRLFQDRSDIGLLYPVTTTSLSYWAHHWLRNSGQAAGLFTRLGVDSYPREGYFPYPVGGMFWARVEAIRPLLEAGFGFDDFPPEEGQIDGTLAHAIERSFVPLVHARGYRFVEFDQSTGAFHLDWSTLNLDQYLGLSLDGLCRAIDQVDMVSFDIFDTLVTRLSVRPDSVMRATGVRVARQYPGATDFFLRRKEAETSARQAKHWEGDVTLTEIYDAFPRDENWTSEVVDAACSFELSGDLLTTIPRGAIVKAVNYAADAGKRVIAVSDTYLERPHVDQMLKSVGIEDLFDEVYLSSECGHRKDRGDMWDLLEQREGAYAGRWLHVGDNEQSDIQATTDRRIANYHCMNPTTLMGLRGLGGVTTPDADYWGNDLLMGPTVARVANDPFPENGQFRPVDIPYPTDVGYSVFGPVVLGFLTWLANHPALEAVDHVFFLSREGLLLREAWEKVRAEVARDLPASTYLLTSRRSSMASAQGVRFNPHEILEGSGFEGTAKDLLSSRLGLELESDDPFLDDTISLPEDEGAMLGFLERHQDQIVAHGLDEFDGLSGYLEASGLGTSATPAVVDIGYSATIQKHLQTVLHRGLVGFYMGTVVKARQVEEAGGSAFGCFIENLPEWTGSSPFLVHSLILEAFLTAPHGQTERSEVRDGEVVHTFRTDHRTPQELDVIDLLHAGVLTYVDDVLAAYGRTILDVPIDPDVALTTVVALAKGTIRSRRVAAGLVVDDDYCGVSRRSAPIAGGTER